MAAFVFKLGTLTIKTIAKPFATRVQEFVLSHPTLRPPFIRFAQFLHRTEVRINRGAEGLTTRVFIGDISEEKAVELAGKFISEAFIWTVATAVLGLELARQSHNDGIKRAKDQAYRDHVEALHREEQQALRKQVERQDAFNKRFVERLDKLEQLAEQLEEQRLRQQNSYWNMFGIKPLSSQ